MRRILSLLLVMVMTATVMLWVVPPIEVSAATTYEFLFPVNNGGKIAYVYGYSSDYFDNTTFHYGIDIHSSGDQVIYAAFSGKVITVNNSCGHVNYGKNCGHDKGFGNSIYIQSKDGKLYSIYGHLKRDSMLVNEGDEVKQGQPIAYMGSSGWSTGKHLHFEVRTNAAQQSTAINVNPINKNGLVKYITDGYLPIPTLRVNYHVNGGTITNTNYYLSGSMVYLKSTSKLVAFVCQYGVKVDNGLHNDTTFGLVRDGYEFVGWSLTSDGSGKIFDQDTPCKPEDLVPELVNGDKTVTMYAIWEKVGCDHNYHIKDDSYDTNFKAFPYAKITNDNLFDADHNKMNANNWIAATDECTILEVYTDGCCKVTYPLDSGGTRTLYSKISLFNIVYECDHSYTYKSNSTGHWKECTLCGDKQTTSSHTYTNNCDKSCNTCGYTRSISHTYSNSCDTSCNVCGETRTITHTYGSTYSYNSVDHWKTCTVCGHYEYITEHTYSNSCDKWCDVCAAERTITHTYSNSCDTSCNVCGETRTTTHSYGSSYGYDSVKHWKSCTICGSASTSSYHYFADSCDTSCNTCGYERTTTHTYDNDCDTSCNVCGETRSTQHVYDDDEDTTCNICNAVRTVETLPTTTPEPETKPNTNNNNQSNSKDEDDDDDINQTTIIIIASAVTISAVSIFGTALVIKKKR